MTTTFQLRLEVLDRPGVLATLAAAIAEGGGNVISIDIHQPDAGVSVDEILVQTTDGWDARAVEQALDLVPGVTLLALSQVSRTRDPVVSALRWARVMLSTNPQEAELELCRAVLEATRARVAWVAELAEAADIRSGQTAIEKGGPVLERVEALPAQLGTELAGPAWLMAVPDDVTDPRTVAFVARPVSDRFSPSEVNRLEALMGLYHQLVTGAGRSGQPSSV